MQVIYFMSIYIYTYIFRLFPFNGYVVFPCILCDPVDTRLLCPLDSPGKNIGVGCMPSLNDSQWLLMFTFFPKTRNP